MRSCNIAYVVYYVLILNVFTIVNCNSFTVWKTKLENNESMKHRLVPTFRIIHKRTPCSSIGCDQTEIKTSDNIINKSVKVNNNSYYFDKNEIGNVVNIPQKRLLVNSIKKRAINIDKLKKYNDTYDTNIMAQVLYFPMITNEKQKDEENKPLSDIRYNFKQQVRERDDVNNVTKKPEEELKEKIWDMLNTNHVNISSYQKQKPKLFEYLNTVLNKTYTNNVTDVKTVNFTKSMTEHLEQNKLNGHSVKIISQVTKRNTEYPHRKYSNGERDSEEFNGQSYSPIKSINEDRNNGYDLLEHVKVLNSQETQNITNKSFQEKDNRHNIDKNKSKVLNSEKIKKLSSVYTKNKHNNFNNNVDNNEHSRNKNEYAETTSVFRKLNTTKYQQTRFNSKLNKTGLQHLSVTNKMSQDIIPQANSAIAGHADRNNQETNSNNYEQNILQQIQSNKPTFKNRNAEDSKSFIINPNSRLPIIHDIKSPAVRNKLVLMGEQPKNYYESNIKEYPQLEINNKIYKRIYSILLNSYSYGTYTNNESKSINTYKLKNITNEIIDIFNIPIYINELCQNLRSPKIIKNLESNINDHREKNLIKEDWTKKFLPTNKTDGLNRKHADTTNSRLIPELYVNIDKIENSPEFNIHIEPNKNNFDTTKPFHIKPDEKYHNSFAKTRPVKLIKKKQRLEQSEITKKVLQKAESDLKTFFIKDDKNKTNMENSKDNKQFLGYTSVEDTLSSPISSFDKVANKDLMTNEMTRLSVPFSMLEKEATVSSNINQSPESLKLDFDNTLINNKPEKQAIHKIVEYTKQNTGTTNRAEKPQGSYKSDIRKNVLNLETIPKNSYSLANSLITTIETPFAVSSTIDPYLQKYNIEDKNGEVTNAFIKTSQLSTPMTMRDHKDAVAVKLHKNLNSKPLNKSSIYPYPTHQFNEKYNTTEPLSFSHLPNQHLQIIGDGIKIPLKIQTKPDGTLLLAVDFDILCQDYCKNYTCNHANKTMTLNQTAFIESEQTEKENYNFNKINISENNDKLFQELENLDPDQLRQIVNEALNYQFEENKNLNTKRTKQDMSKMLQEYDEVINFLHSFNENDLQRFLLNSTNV